ncbi:hypothetical protein RRG08_043679 [Elysia crispata]|uniref:Uncharacterized protein n=1 Tax=Elysia crispata TaxID=231223 RepID=A0AAE1DMF5_9GAST|nr:hypothetical protein RRG08_043679 [Elysia crispata]
MLELQRRIWLTESRIVPGFLGEIKGSDRVTSADKTNIDYRLSKTFPNLSVIVSPQNLLSPPHFLLIRQAADSVVGGILFSRVSALHTTKNAASAMAAITLPACAKQQDSGASVNVIPKKYAKNLHPGSAFLTSFGGSTLSCVGKLEKSSKNAQTGQKFTIGFVLCDQDVQPVLGLRAAEQNGSNFCLSKTITLNK